MNEKNNKIKQKSQRYVKQLFEDADTSLVSNHMIWNNLGSFRPHVFQSMDVEYIIYSQYYNDIAQLLSIIRCRYIGMIKNRDMTME